MTKTEFRKKATLELKSIPNCTRYSKNWRANRVLGQLLKRLKYKNILLYWPLQNEVDIRKIAINLRKNKNVYLPFMQGVSFKMVPFRLPLERKSFGIYEPLDSYLKINKIDIVVVPVIGVDGGFGRVGFGKGMYDRFFPTLKSKPLIIFIQLKRCYTNSFVCDDFDVVGDLLISPSGVLTPRNSYVNEPTSRKRGITRKRTGRFSHLKKDYSISF